MPPLQQVLFVTRKWAPATGGMETYSIKLSEALTRHAAVTVVALKGRRDGMPPGPLALLLFPFTVLRAWLRMPRRPAVLHLGDLAIWPLGLLAGRATRLVITAHGTDIVYARRNHWRGRVYWAYLALGRKLLRHPTMIANSRATAAALHEAGWPDAHCVPLATDLTVGTIPEPAPKHILFVGRLVERKGCAWFIREVLPLLPDDMRLTVIGPAWEEAERAALADPRVDYCGHVAHADLVTAYGEALCVVMPNIPVASGDYEGFGIVAPEAAAAGGIVLAARHGGLEDAIIDGETGFLLAPADAPIWARAIRDIAHWDAARRAAFSHRARQTVAARYSWDRVAHDTAALYRAA